MKEFAMLIPLEIYQKTNPLIEQLENEKGSKLDVKEIQKAYEEKYGNTKIKSFILTNDGIEEIEKVIMDKNKIRFFESDEEKEKIIKEYENEYHVEFTKEDVIDKFNNILNLDIPMTITKEFTMKEFTNTMKEGLKETLEKLEIKNNDSVEKLLKEIYFIGTMNALNFFSK